MLDYPHLNHEHQTLFRYDQGKLRIETTSLDILSTLATSPCLVPANVPELHAFRKTQFGFEANGDCVSGRPFLDSLIPSTVDPTNPYLSFKLGDVDVVPVPEDRFHEMNQDPDLKLFPGGKHFLYLKSSGLTQQEVAYITQSLNVEELVRTVLNDHAEASLTRSSEASVAKTPLTIAFPVPMEDPYRLLVQRMIVQLEEAGITIDTATKQTRSIELGVVPITESDFDISRYLLLRNDLKISVTGEWFDEWDELEASGKIIPLMVHQSWIAARQQIQDLRVRGNGMTDFSNCWLLPQESE
jgi:hypothetical protein